MNIISCYNKYINSLIVKEMLDYIFNVRYHNVNIYYVRVCHINLKPNNFELEQTTIWSFKDRESGLHIQENIEEIGPHIFQEI